jgi:hypothetical protein
VDVKNTGHMPKLGEIGDNAPLRLAVAAALAYPDGKPISKVYVARLPGRASP